MRNSFILVLLLCSVGAFACDCRMLKVDSAVAAGYDVIFEGDVVAISGCDGKSQVKFMIRELFRGASYQSASFEFDCSSDCQLSFTPGEHWIIYADYVSYGKGRIDFCSPSRKQAKPGENDFYSVQNGMSFTEESAFLHKVFGSRDFLVSKPSDQLHHENIKPTVWQQVWLLIASIAGVGLFYFVVKRLLR